MSKQIDERVVSMQFDNRHFEKNVATTMSTLDKLKEKLNLQGASKGLGDINSAAKKVDMTGLANGVDAVRSRFSALEVMGVTALANITNSAVNAGKKIVSALTIDPIKTGLDEYETKINAIQVIKANTRGKNTMDEITAALDELNDYADRTIYNFAQMTNNVGKFVAQGLDIKQATNAVQGMANLAGASGASAEDMARATYQMSQALGGVIRKIDWNSLRNANMATVELKNTLSDLARVKGIDIDGMIAKKGTFEDTLESGWLTGELFTEAMNIYSDAYSEAELKAMGFNDKQIANFKDLAKMAAEATTEVKTFSQLFDVLKETAQSGWTQTWELIIGDFDTAKKMLTSLQVYFSGIIDKMSDARNFIVEAVMNISKPWKTIMDKLSGSGLGNVQKVTKSIDNITDKLQHFQEVVNKVWRGDFNNHGDNPDRFDLLEKAGYDHRVVQDLVNKGYQYKLTTEDVEASHKKFGLTMEKTSKSTKESAVSIEKLSDKQLKNAGLTKDEINLYRDLEREAARTGVTINELVESMSKKDGRTLLIDSIKNAWSGVVGIFKALKKAWEEIFPPVSIVRIYNIIKAVNEFSEKLRLTDKKTGKLTDTAKKLQRTFKGVFALINIIATIMGGAFKIAFKAITQLLGMFNLDILDLTAMVGDALVKFKEWFDTIFDFTGIFKVLIPIVKEVITAFAFVASVVSIMIRQSKAIKNLSDAFKNAGTSFKEWIETLKSSDNIGRDIIEGLIKGLGHGVNLVWQAIISIGETILNLIKNVLGIHSPSTEFFEIGKNIILGLVLGIQNGLSNLWNTLQNIASNIIGFVKSIDWGTVFAGGISLALTVTMVRIGNAIARMTEPLDGLGEMFEDVGEGLKAMFKGIGANFKASAWEKRGRAILNMAIAICILAASVYVLSTIEDTDSLWRAVGAIGALAGIMIVLAGAVTLMGKIKDFSFAKFSIALIAIAGSVLLLAKTVKIIGSLDPKQALVGIAGITALIMGISFLLFTYGQFVKGKAAMNIDKAGMTILKISAAMLLLVGVAKIIAGMEWADMGKAAVGLMGLGFIIAALMTVTLLAEKNINKVGPTLLKIAAAMLLLTFTAKIIAAMEWADMGKAAVGLIGLVGIVALLILATNLANPWVDKLGSTILALAVAMGALTIVAKIIAGMEWGEMGKAAVGLVGLVGVVALLVLVVKMVEKDAPKIAATLLALSMSLGILAAVVILLGFIDLAHMAKGIAAVGMLAVMMSLMIKATRGASDCKKNLIIMTIAIGVMATAIAALSFIDPTKLAGATLALSMVMGMFALIIKAGSNMKSSLGTLIIMTIAIGVLGGLIYLLAGLPVESTIAAAASLSMLLLSMSVSLSVLSLIGKTGKEALKGVGLLLAMAVPLLAFTLVIRSMQDIQGAVKNAFALIALTTAMTLLLIPLALVGVLWTQAAIGMVALTAMAIPLLVFVGIIKSMKDLQGAEGNVNMLVSFMKTMTELLVVLAIIGPFALIGVKAMNSLIALMLKVGALAIAAGYIMDKFPAIEKFLDSGIPILEKLAYAVGSIIGSFAAGVTSGLPKIGSNLSEFMTNATPFINGARMIDDKMMAGVKSLAETVLILTATDVIEGLTSWLTGGSSLANFGSQLGSLGSHLNQFATNLGTFDESKVTTITCASKAVKAMAEASEALPNEGGWVAKIVGDNSIAAFGAKLPTLGTHLNQFATNLGTFDETKVSTVTCAANAIKAMAEASEALPNEGGWVSKIVGDNSIATFASKLPELGTHLNQFAKNLGTFDEAKVNSVSCASKAVKAMAEAASNIDGQSEWAKKLFGDNSLSSFGSQLETLGTNLNGFATNLGTFDQSKVNTVNSAVKAIKAISELADADIKGAKKHLKDFSKEISDFGTDISDFCSNMPSGESITAAINNINNIINVVRNMAGVDAKAASDFTDSLGKVGKKGIDKFVDAFTSNSAKTDVKKAGEDLIKGVIKGAESKEFTLDKAFKELAKSAADATEDKYQSFYNAGKYLVEGFASGINDNTYKATAKSRAMAYAAAEAARIALSINSPSKVFRTIGASVPEGFAMGIDKLRSMVTGSSTDMANAAISNVKSSISRMASIIGSDVDTQPTIRPVLDLSNISSGAGKINDMLDVQPSVGLLANIKSIDSMMNQRGQNGRNDDVVSALKDLKKTIGKTGNTYSINGISYNEGDDVSEAIKTLVRYIKIDGRA